MKRPESRASLLVLLALTALPATGQEWQHLQGGRVLDVFTPDGVSAWTAEDGGRIRHTGDGGESWSFQETPDDVRAPLRGVFLLDDTLGWAVGDGGLVLGTVDGGESWERLNAQPVLDLLHEPARLQAAHFVDPSRGWVVGDNRVLVATHDGGATWSYAQPLPEHAYTPEDPITDYYAVTFLDEHTGFVVGDQGTLLRTYDGGLTWERAPLPGAHQAVYLWDIEFAGWRGIAVGGEGNQQGWRLVSLDGGLTWSRDGCSLGFGPSSTTQYGLTLFDDTGGGLSCGYASQILSKATAGDACWSGNHLFTGQGNASVPLRAAHGDESGRAWVVGEFGTIRRTLDQGGRWSNQGSSMALRPGALCFLDADVGLVAGQHQRIARTVDGGRTWVDVFNGQAANRFSGLAVDAAGVHGVAVGKVTPTPGGPQALAMWSADGGQTWAPAGLPPGWPAVDLRDATFGPDGRAWAVGATATILRSGDGGRTWEHASSPPVHGLLDAVAFGEEARVGFVAGLQGAWRTDDAGVSWHPLPVVTAGGPGRVRDVAVRGVDDVWAVGDGGAVWRLDPATGRLRPVELPFPFEVPLQAVAVVDSPGVPAGLEVFAAGDGGTVLWFDGETWSLPKSHTSLGLVDLSFVSADLGFAVASHGFAIQVWR